MHAKSIQIILFFLFFSLSAGIYAQDVNSVDPKTLPDSEIQKVEDYMKNAGLSFQEAAAIARQRGATEQQIRDMRQRLTESQTTPSASSSANESTTDTFMESPEAASDSSDLSTRKAPVQKDNPVFGSYLFNNENLTFEPSLNIQTPGDYEIGIGDQIIVNIWGNSQNNYQLTVNTNGQIMIPDVGPVFVAGMTFDAAELKIKQRLTDIYADMAGQNPQTFAQINIGRLRSVKVDLVGEVTAPGTYTLPATASVFNALYLSGGPNIIGSFRNIKVIRNNTVTRTVDAYKFLIDADISENIKLNDQDIIFIPAAQKKVTATGEFKRTGIFEMKADESLKDLVRFTGGFTENAWWSVLKIYRKTLSGRSIIDVPFSQAETVVLQDGDSITTSEITDIYENRVMITGPVFQPGEYEWKQGMSLTDLIRKAGSLRGDAFLNRGNIIRLNHDFTTSSISFDLKDVLAGKETVLLQPEDIVLIKSKFELMEEQYISVSGEVLNPGQIAYSDNLTLGDAIFRAGSFTEAADSSFIEVARRLSYEEAAVLSDEMVHIYTFDLTRDLKLNKEDADFVLQPFDQVSVRKSPGYRESASATVNGEVKYAGRYAIENKNQHISDLVKMAGGLTDQAFVKGATFSRQTEELGSEFVAIDLDKIMSNPGGENDLYLRSGDELNIPEFIQTVKVTGSVQNPFSITYEEGKSLLYYIDKCGGFSPEAMKRKTYVRYPNGATASTSFFLLKNYPEVLPGSQIVVPAKPEKEGLNTTQWLSIASTFSSIAVAIAAVLR